MSVIPGFSNFALGQQLDPEIIERTFKLLKVYFQPDANLCISDSTYNLDWFKVDYINDYCNKAIEEYSKTNEFAKDTISYSRTLMECAHNLCPDSSEANLIIKFSQPYSLIPYFDGIMLRCDVIPFQPTKSNSSNFYATSFLICYSKDYYTLSKIVR